MTQAPLWRWTTLHVGGPARLLVQPRNEEELTTAVAWAQRHDTPLLVLGGGSNLLVGEEGFPGLVLVTRGLRGAQRDGTQVTVACGEPLSGLARRLNRIGLCGLEWACGIPGTVGGAVTMNAGAAGSDVSSALRSVRLWRDGGVKSVPADQLQLGYRTSALRTGAMSGVVVDATFELRPDDPSRCREREREVLAMRRKDQPRGASAGCIFKNPQKGPPAGALLDQAGCKGLRVGRAVVSEVHANFIINRGSQNAGDVLSLIRLMQARVQDAHGVLLEPEVEIVEQGGQAA